ncbi:hypothetical protein CLF_104082 [Clonorchis sinensis]|uniref:Uncharacterized protein n=1 Tax=Clonorchis sinensis TaxID=79923 RepID=G7YAX6_CLOSI|nr:hypothetical protein CLF_104082 [Clonorchis sinensis]
MWSKTKGELIGCESPLVKVRTAVTCFLRSTVATRVPYCPWTCGGRLTSCSLRARVLCVLSMLGFPICRCVCVYVGVST